MKIYQNIDKWLAETAAFITVWLEKACRIKRAALHVGIIKCWLRPTNSRVTVVIATKSSTKLTALLTRVYWEGYVALRKSFIRNTTRWTFSISITFEEKNTIIYEK